MPEPKRPLKVFLCHASTDKPKVRELYRYLKKRGIQPWFDEEDLVGGQDWQVEIPKALATSDAIIICLTKNSVDKEGYIQKEIKFALDKALEMPEGRIFLIPVKFEECEVPFSLSRYQWVDLTVESGYAKMMKALKFRASQLERSTVEVSKKDVEEENLAFEKAEKETVEKARLEDEDQTRQKATQEKLERELNEFSEQEKGLHKKWAYEIREKAHYGAEKKKVDSAYVKSKTGNRKVYLYVYFALVGLGIVFWVSLNTSFPSLELAFGNAKTGTAYKFNSTETIYNNTGTPLVLENTETPTVSPNRLTVGGSLINISNIENLVSLFNNEFDGTIVDAAWSPDSKILAISEERNYRDDVSARIHLIDSLTGNLLRIIESNEYEYRISSIKFSPDGRLIVGAGSEKVYVWEVGDGKIVYEFAGSTTDLVFSPDGKALAAGSYSERNVRLWSMGDGSEVYVINNFYLPVHTLVFSLDGKMLIVAVDNELFFLNASDGEIIKVVEHQSRSPINCIKLSPDGVLLASGSRSEFYSGALGLWRVSDGSLVKSTSTQVDCNSMTFSSDGKWLAFASGMVVRMWEMGSENEREFIGHDILVDGVSFSLDNSVLIASASAGGYSTSELYWDMENESDAKVFKASGIIFSNDGSLLLYKPNRNPKYISVWGVP